MIVDNLKVAHHIALHPRFPAAEAHLRLGFSCPFGIDGEVGGLPRLHTCRGQQSPTVLVLWLRCCQCVKVLTYRELVEKLALFQNLLKSIKLFTLEANVCTVKKQQLFSHFCHKSK